MGGASAVDARQPGQPAVVIGFCAVGALWGLAFLFTALALRGFTPLQVAWGRAALAAVALAALAAALERGRLRRALAGLPHRPLIALGLLNAAVPYALIAIAQRHVPSGVAAVFNATVPILTALIALGTGAERRMTPRATAGTVLGFLGILVMTGFAVSGGSWTARIALLAASASYAVSFVIASRPTVRAAAGVPSAAVQMAIAAVVLGAAQIADPFDRPGADPAAWPALVAVALVSTAIPAAVYFWLVRHAGPARASLTTYLVPVVGLLAGWLALHEVPTPLGMLGAATVLAGVALGHAGGSRRTSSAPAERRTS